MCSITQALQRCCFALLLAGGQASSLYAQPHPGDTPIQFKHLTTDDGLSSNLITTVL